MFAEAIDDILRDQCTPTVVRAIESGADPLPLWRAVADAGFLNLMQPEEEGGAGLPLPELYAVVAQFGRYAVPLPLADAIAARALVPAGVQLPDGPLALAPALLHRTDGSVHAPLVPFGAIAQHVLAADGDRLVLLSCEEARRVPTGIPHSLAATLEWANGGGAERLTREAVALAPFAAALQAAMLAGAMTRVFDMTLQYCNERSQFGRTLGKFQAIQHQLAVMAELVAAAGIAAEAAYQSPGRVPRLLAAAMAKARASEAAPAVANTAHAVHGAIGVTEEYDLQLFTRRMHAMRIAHGSESHWNRIVGQQVLAGSGSLTEFVRGA
ncbi:acyl-CoA dehydrogenase family protein [Variovorax sp. DT-64]|uniref:acyl-CoA dehydrogenase family protein n=1 Tax=Variovorax sp. DT-64 TaxID=3396160 RepID=UPI003F1C2512